MRLSTKGRYGMRAMLDLAMHPDQEPISVKSIAERQNISIHYLEQMFHKLRKAGLVKSVRGVKGGYSLAKRPEDIRASDIMIALGESLSPVKCVDGDIEDAECERAEHCVTRTLWINLKDKINEVLGTTTLEDLRGEARDM